jgi:type IV pilus assembly protein PilW
MERLKENGFTLVELMIAMVIGLIMTGVVVAVFVDNRHSFNQGENIQRMQDDARQAIRELANDLSMAGFWADLLLPTSITVDASLAVATDCGPAGTPNWIYQAVSPGTDQSIAIGGVDNATGAAANAAFSCITAGEIEPGTDIVSIKRLAGAEVDPADIEAGHVYLRTNGTLALLYLEPGAAPPAVVVPAPFREWEYRPSIYYIRNFALTAGDGVPTLCRKVLRWQGTTPTMATECIAQGVENLQVEYGLDTDGDGDPNAYVSSPTLAQLQMAVSARIDLLTRSAEDDIRYDNDKTYSISNAPDYTPDDNFYRRVYSITVGLHNLKSLRVLRG